MQTQSLTILLLLLAPAAALAASIEGLAAAVKDGHQLDMWCILYRCGSSSSACMIEQKCRDGLFCLRNCISDQHCSIGCLYRYQSQRLTEFLSCAVHENQCVQLKKEDADAEFECHHPQWTEKINDIEMIDGAWYAVRGRHSFHDCHDCRSELIDLAAGSITSSFRFFHGGSHEADESHSMVRHVRSVQSRFAFNNSLLLSMISAGQPATEIWHFAKLPDYPHDDLLVVTYCGSAGVWRYQGQLLLSRSASPAHFTLPPEHEFTCSIPHGNHCLDQHDAEEL